MNAFDDAIGRAPRTSGVYLFLGADRDLLYVGKAANLRRRIADHARDRSRTSDLRRRVLLDAVRHVSWEETLDEAAARVREADLIVFLRPAFNASHTEQARDCYVRSDDASRARFTVTGDSSAAGRSYGTFPHLAPGAFSAVAKQTKDGWRAFLRLYDAAGRTDTPALHDFLSGRSARLLRKLGAGLDALEVPAFTRTALERDVDDAQRFFALGPARLREFRLRHSLPPGPVLGETMAARLADEVRATVGEFRPGDPPGDGIGLSRRAARARELRARVHASD